MLDAGLQTKIERIVEAALAPESVVSVVSREGQDYDANNVIFVSVTLSTQAGPLSGAKYLEAMRETSRMLLTSHDERMPLFRTMREGEEEFVDVETEPL